MFVSYILTFIELYIYIYFNNHSNLFKFFLFRATLPLGESSNDCELRCSYYNGT